MQQLPGALEEYLCERVEGLHDSCQLAENTICKLVYLVQDHKVCTPAVQLTR